MKQPTLAFALAAAAWLLLQPFMHWLVRWQIEPLRLTIAVIVCAIFMLLVSHAAKRRHATWSGCFAAIAVAINPIWPIAAPERAHMLIGTVAGVVAAIYAVRRWK